MTAKSVSCTGSTGTASPGSAGRPTGPEFDPTPPQCSGLSPRLLSAMDPGARGLERLKRPATRRVVGFGRIPKSTLAHERQRTLRVRSVELARGDAVRG